MTLPVIHRVTTLDLDVQPWSWPFADSAARRDHRRISPAKQREKPQIWNGRILLGRNPVFSRSGFQRQLFRDRFCQSSWPGATGVFRTRMCSTVSAWARCAAMTAPSCSARWASIPPMPGASIFRQARPISTISAAARSTWPAAWRAKSRRKPGWPRPTTAPIAHWDCVVSGAAVAMIRLLHVDAPGEALRARIEANLARQRRARTFRHPSGARCRAISPRRCRALSPPSSKRNFQGRSSSPG